MRMPIQHTAIGAICRSVFAAVLLDLGGCFPGSGEIGEGEPPAAFCGILYGCGSHSDRSGDTARAGDSERGGGISGISGAAPTDPRPPTGE